MSKYFKYVFIILFVLFSFYYTDKVTKIAEYNDIIMASINEYAKTHDYKCKEGIITSDGIILGLSGLYVNKNKSYSNMKGSIFNEQLIEYDVDECIVSLKNNYDKYILSGNGYENKVSIVIDVINGKHFIDMNEIAESKGYVLNFLFNYNMLNKYIDSIDNYSNILFKGNNDELDDFIKILHDEFYCTNKNSDILKSCALKKMNSINVINYFDKNILSNIKKVLNKGVIIFIKESEYNLDELSATFNYIKSRGYDIVSINELLS